MVASEGSFVVLDQSAWVQSVIQSVSQLILLFRFFLSAVLYLSFLSVVIVYFILIYTKSTFVHSYSLLIPT